ncbi:hypothetical protein PIB30_053305 [Stylosanthes scabra]|uniref:Uncharacterized protein n=1 Tax=Stylosanthes scabra TaxID=79078 RepID=A0ABU6XHK3_9FABA|nr:hypothetical protein [Stylosanthes scabra]
MGCLPPSACLSSLSLTQRLFLWWLKVVVANILGKGFTVASHVGRKVMHWNLRSPGSLHNVLNHITYSGQTSLILRRNIDDSIFGETRPYMPEGMLCQLSKLEPAPEKPEISGVRIPNPWILSTDKAPKPQ